MKKVLISGLGGSLFPYLHEQLKSKFQLYYIDSNENLKAIYPSVNFIQMPSVTDSSYFNRVKEIILKNHIDAYLPLIDEEIKPAIETCGKDVIVVAPTTQFVDLCLDKYKLMIELDKRKVSFIKSFPASDYNGEFNFPIFLKPITGRGSRGIFKIENSRQFEGYFLLNEQYAKKDVLVQEYVDGTEYTVGVLTNNLNQIISINTKKVIAKKGITQHAVTEHNLEIEKIVTQIVKEFNPCGPFNVQLFVTHSGEIKIFEINPRFSTTTIMSYAGNVDKLSLFLEYFNRKFDSPIIRPKAGIVLYRRWENVFYNA